jgi:hypothetical protein
MWPREVVFLLFPVQDVSEPDAPGNVEVGSHTGQQMPRDTLYISGLVEK